MIDNLEAAQRVHKRSNRRITQRKLGAPGTVLYGQCAELRNPGMPV
jgi:hypothetical protein